MRRALQVAVNYVAPLILLWVALTISGITLQVLSALWLLFIAAAWLAWRFAQAVGDVRSIVHGWRVRRRADPIADYRIGAPPVRPDAVANRAT
jgi:hypothetical protein